MGTWARSECGVCSVCFARCHSSRTSLLSSFISKGSFLGKRRPWCLQVFRATLRVLVFISWCGCSRTTISEVEINTEINLTNGGWVCQTTKWNFVSKAHLMWVMERPYYPPCIKNKIKCTDWQLFHPAPICCQMLGRGRLPPFGLSYGC